MYFQNILGPLNGNITTKTIAIFLKYSMKYSFLESVCNFTFPVI